jgi:hypothetical protein
MLAPVCGSVFDAADYPWQDAFSWAETLTRDRQTTEFLLVKIAWATMYSPLAAQGAKDIPDAPKPPQWMME